MKSIDPIDLQRLTDGELSGVQIKTLVNDAQANPDQWPVIAKAFIEEQLWLQQISAAVDAVDADAHRSIPSTQLLDDNGPGRSGRLWGWLAMAAAVMVAGFLGYTVANNTVAQPEVLAGVGSVAQSISNSTASKNVQPKYHLEVGEDSQLVSHGLTAGRVPLYAVSDPEQLHEYQQQTFEPISRELLQQLTDAGYRVNNDIELISANVSDHQQFVVPVRTIRLQPSQ